MFGRGRTGSGVALHTVRQTCGDCPRGWAKFTHTHARIVEGCDGGSTPTAGLDDAGSTHEVERPRTPARTAVALIAADVIDDDRTRTTVGNVAREVLRNCDGSRADRRRWRMIASAVEDPNRETGLALLARAIGSFDGDAA